MMSQATIAKGMDLKDCLTRVQPPKRKGKRYKIYVIQDTEILDEGESDDPMEIASLDLFYVQLFNKELRDGSAVIEIEDNVV